MTLSEISQHTKIRVEILQSIEQNKYDVLPNSFFIKSFLIQFAKVVDMDEAEILALYSQGALQPPRGKSTSESQVTVDSILNAGNIPEASSANQARKSVTIVFFVLIGSLGLLYFIGSMPGTNSATQSVTSVDGSEARKATIVQVERNLVQQAPADTVAVTTGEPVKVFIQSQALVWLSWSVDNEEQQEAMLQRNEQLSVTARSEILLTVGDAGSVTLQINGETVPAIGGSGDVRHLKITPTRWDFIRK